MAQSGSPFRPPPARRNPRDIASAAVQGADLMAALGLNPDDHVRGISINCEAGELITVQVERNLTVEQVEAVSAVLAKYKMVPKDEPEAPNSTTVGELTVSVNCDTTDAHAKIAALAAAIKNVQTLARAAGLGW